MNETLETVGTVHTHTHTHTSQFLNNRNAIAVLYEGVFCVDAACAESVASGFDGVLFFVNYTEIVRRLTETLSLIWVSYEAWIGSIVLVSLFGEWKICLYFRGFSMWLNCKSGRFKLTLDSSVVKVIEKFFLLPTHTEPKKFILCTFTPLSIVPKFEQVLFKLVLKIYK